MTDISALQAEWQKELSPLQENEAKAIQLEQAYLSRIEDIGDKYKDPHGFSRLRKAFAVATKVAPLRRKKMKIEKNLAAEESKIKNLAASTFTALGDTVARDSAKGAEFEYLETAISQIRDTQELVNKAAKKCRNASVAETGAAIGDNVSIDSNAFSSDNAEAVIIAEVIHIGADIMASMSARKATKALREAEEAVRSLQKTVQEEIPRVNSALANDISSSNSSTLMMDAFGGILASFSNWDMAGQLNDAKNHLHGVSEQLDNTISKLAHDKRTLAQTALTEARKSDSAVQKFAAELENFMLPPDLRKTPEPSVPRLDW